MDNLTLIAIIIKSILAGLLIVGGIVAIFIGRGLYIRGVGLNPDGTQVEIDNIKASLKTVGSVVMATSVAWGFFGYLSSPDLLSSEHGKDVVSLKIPNLDVTAKAFAYTLTDSDSQKILSDPLELKAAFAKAYHNAQAGGQLVKVNDVPVMLSKDRVITLKTDVQKFNLVSFINSNEGEIKITYIPTVEKGSVIFKVKDIGVLEASNVTRDDKPKS